MNAKIKISDILGPVMIGPSSSHTAGACRIGKLSAQIYGKDFHKVRFELHGSFGETYHGHGTDRALLAGVMGFNPDDEQIKNAFAIAEERGLIYEFVKKDLGFVHPNTVKITFYGEDEPFYTIGSSIGGGNIQMINIDGIEVEFTGEYATILVTYRDRKRMIYDIAKEISNADINIATLTVSRKDNLCQMVVSLDSPFTQDLIDALSHLDHVLFVRGLSVE